jgi:hypothetical protein
MVSVVDVLLPTLSAWGQPIRKPRIQLHREVFSPRIRTLEMSLERTMVFNADM